MALELEALLNNDDSTATLILPPRFDPVSENNPYIGQPRPIRGIVTNGSFNVGGSNTFSNPTSASGSESVMNGIKTFSDTMQSLSSNQRVVNSQIVSGLSTIKTWDASADFTFSLELTFIATTSKTLKDRVSGTDDVTLPCIELLSLVYPSVSNALSLGNIKSLVYVISAPAGYAPVKTNDIESDNENTRVSGVVQIAIANWLRLSNMVCNSCSCSFSKEIQRNGSPLYAQVQLEFSCYRTFTYADVIQMFNSNRKIDIMTDDEYDSKGKLYKQGLIKNAIEQTSGKSSRVLGASSLVNQAIREAQKLILPKK